MSHPRVVRPEKAGLDLSAGIVVGIDPGLDKHAVVALLAGSCYRLARREIANSIAGMGLLAKLLGEWSQQSGGRLTIGIEETTAFGEGLECYLDQAGFQLMVVSETKVARFREVIQADVNDLNDAEAVARLLIFQPDLCRVPARVVLERDAQGDQHDRLRRLSRRHQRWTRERITACNELHHMLRMVWLVDYQSFFSEVQGVAALAFWQAYPTPLEAAGSDPETIAELLDRASGHRLGKVKSSRKAWHIHEVARQLVAGLGGKNSRRWADRADDIRTTARHLSYVVDQIKGLEARMKEVLKEIRTPLTGMKGLGTVIAATIHGEILSVDRFATADRFARYNGTAPRSDSTGRSPRQVKNQRCNHRLKRVFLQLALTAMQHEPVSRAYCQQLQARGVRGGAARLRLARRLSDVVYAMLKNNRPYSVEYFMERKRKTA